MSIPQFQSTITKIKAYKLIHDPTRLFCLLYSKYGDIEEEYDLFYSNQIVYNEYTHFNTLFKEHLYNSYEEFIKRFYHYSEIKQRIEKLNEYYYNYLKFFSKPMFVNSFYNKLVNKYYDSKAEIFYVNNLTKKNKSQIAKKHKNNINNESILSSIDNDTENDIIFNKRIKKMIDNNLNTNSCTITLNINTKNDLNYINNKNISNSFIDYVGNIVNYQTNQKNIKEENILKNNKIEEINKNNKIEEIKKTNITKENKKINNIKEKQKNIECINNEFLMDLKNHDKDKNLEPINKFKIQHNQKKIKLFLNDENIIEKNKLGKIQELNNFNISNRNKYIKLNNQKSLSPLNSKEINLLGDKRNSKKIFSKKNLSIGFNINIYKSPLNKINYINFYSPQNNQEKKYILNKQITPINYKNNPNFFKDIKSIDIKVKKNSSLSEILINPGLLSINIENSDKKIYNKKFKLFPKNLKNNIQKMKNINVTKQINYNNLNIKNIKIKTIKNKRNQSQKNMTLKDSIYNLNGEKKILNNGNLALSSIVVKKNNTNFINKGKTLINNDIYQYFEVKNNSSNIFENNSSKNNYKNGNKFHYQEVNKIGGNINIFGKKIFFPINFKKSFNKRDINDKNYNLGLNMI